MTIKPRQMQVSSSKYSIKCPNSMNAEYITFHNTANDASADSEISYMIRNNNEVSFHFAVDDEEIVQGIPTNRNAWHCGDGNGTGNRKSIGVEICYSKSGGQRYRDAEALGIKFIAQLLHERGWGVDRVKQHHHWSGKNCPHRVRAEGRWDVVVDDIQKELNKLKGQLTAPTSTPSGDLGLVDWMNANEMNSSFSNREKLAKQHGISNYNGTATQNTELLVKLQDAKKKVVAAESKPTQSTYRLLTGTFGSKSDQHKAAEKIRKLTGWLIYEIDESGLRLKTGTFGSKDSVEKAQKLIKDKFGYLTYIVE